MNTPFYLEELRKHVLKKAGIKHVDPGDCRFISDQIYHETRKYVSETTIKRFFGYANTQFNFSGFTLNSLAQYIGFESWKNFCEGHKITEKSSATDVWNNLRQKAAVITDYSLRVVRNNSGIPFEITAKRKFAYIDYQYFLKSDTQISCLVAPAGYGKSVVMAQMVTDLLSDKHVNQDDIMLFINMDIITNISALGFDLNDWIREEVGLGEKAGYRTYFEAHPEACKGNIIVLIDGFDVGDLKVKYSALMINFLYSIEKAPWIKVMLSMRTNTWLTLRQHIYGSAFLLKSFYKGNFFDTEYYSNLPLLSRDEIIYTLSNIDKKIYKPEDIDKDLLMQLKIPFWFQYYYHFKTAAAKAIPPNSSLLCYELIAGFVKSKIQEDNHSTESLLLLQHISIEMQLLDGVYAVKKNKLLGVINTYPNVYTRLLQKGILIEQKKMINDSPEEVISMLHDFYPYFLFRHLFERSSNRISEALFTHICENYADHIPVRIKLIKWAVRYAIINNETAYLVNIITLPLTIEEKTAAFNFICLVTNYEMEKPGPHALTINISAGFLNLLAKGAVSNSVYRRTLELLIDDVVNNDVKLLLQALLAGIYILELNRSGLKKILFELSKHKERLDELFPVSPFEMIRFHFQKMNQEPVSIDMSEYILTRITGITDAPKKINSLTAHEMVSFRLTIHILYMHHDYKNAMLVMDKIQRLYPKLWYRRTSMFATLSKILIGLNYVKTDNIKAAIRIGYHLEKLIEHSKQVYYTNYVLIRYYIFRAALSKVNRNYAAALNEVEKALILTIEERLDLLSLFLNSKKIDLLRSMGSEDALDKAYSDFNKLLKSNNVSIEQYNTMAIGITG